MLVLFTDTDTDMTPALAKELGYKIISMPYSIDGESVYPYADSDSFDFHTFYDTLRSGKVPTTSGLGEEQYINSFEPVFADGDDIMYVHFSSATTSTFGVMDKAVAALREKYPDRHFYSIDTKGISAISLAIAEEIADLYRAGKSASEILAWAEEEVDHFAMYFFVDDLTFFRHSGRVSNLAGTMGTLLGIRPIIHMNNNGEMISIGKEKGRGKAVARLLAYVDELGDEIEKHRLVIGHTDAPEIAEEIASALREKYGDALNVEITVTNPTIGSHCGPDGVGIAFHCIHR